MTKEELNEWAKPKIKELIDSFGNFKKETEEDKGISIFCLHSINVKDMTLASASMSYHTFNLMLQSFLTTNPEYISLAKDAVTNAVINSEGGISALLAKMLGGISGEDMEKQFGIDSDG